MLIETFFGLKLRKRRDLNGLFSAWPIYFPLITLGLPLVFDRGRKFLRKRTNCLFCCKINYFVLIWTAEKYPVTEWAQKAVLVGGLVLIVPIGHTLVWWKNDFRYYLRVIFRFQSSISYLKNCLSSVLFWKIMRQRKNFPQKGLSVKKKVYSGLKVHCAELFENWGQYLLV